LGFRYFTKAGDVAGCIKKTYSHKDKQIKGVYENLGDTMWYIAMICNYFDWNLEDVLKDNIEKLSKRHLRGFSHNAAKKDRRKDWNEK
jgi:NTP pyrophosphatase (non-canonical NTP hydrolase)